MISVITPAHNEKRFIRDCLCSVQAAARAVSETVEHTVTSCRKFDQWGDWVFIRHPMMVYRIFQHDPQQADHFYYDARSDLTEHDP